MASGSKDGRKSRALSTRELTDITESLRWKAEQDIAAAKRLRGVGGVVEDRWASLHQTLIEQAKRENALADRLEQEDSELILRGPSSDSGK